MRNKFLCVHGHFYQPPRENPWTGELEGEESARPFSNWNERVLRECYGPLAACPLIGEDRRIVDLENLYPRISFNFGPTLLSWIAARHPRLYRNILAADTESVRQRSGHGNALAQPYYHAILPLQTLRDKRTLVRWGLADFESRFGRAAEGLWIPETAVDEETLEVLVEQGLRFALLETTQAARAKDAVEGAAWRDVSERGLDPTRPYLWRSRARPEKSIALFFFFQGLKDAVVEGSALRAPKRLLDMALARVLPGDATQLVHWASDGEFYGHHHQGGAAALALALRLAPDHGLALTNYGEFLDAFPPPQEIEIKPGTSWSCPHGLGRWTTDCGCRSPRHPQWKQDWRAPLREALNWLAAECDALYEKRAGEFLRDFRAAREDYGRRLSSRSPAAAMDFLARHALPGLDPEAAVRALALLELERERLAMFTSCGWFFDDVSGLEAVLCLSRAARAVDLAKSFGVDLATGLAERLAKTPSNMKRLKDGAGVLEKLVWPQRTDVLRAAARLALMDHLGHAACVKLPDFSWERLGGGQARKSGLAGRDRSMTWVDIRLKRLSTLEETALQAVVVQRDRLDLAVWVKPFQERIDGDALLDSFMKNNDMDFENILGAQTHGLDALTPAERLNVYRLLMPSPLKTRERRQFLEKWNAAVSASQRGENEDALLTALLGAKAVTLMPEELPFVELVRERAQAMITALAEGAIAADAAALSRLTRWIAVCEEAGLALDVWALREAFWTWRERLLKDGGTAAERAAACAFGESLGFSPLVLPLQEKTPA